MGGMPHHDDKREETTRSGIICFIPNVRPAKPPLLIGVAAWQMGGAFQVRFLSGWDALPSLPSWVKEAAHACGTGGATLDALQKLRNFEGVSIEAVESSSRPLDEEVALREREAMRFRVDANLSPTYCVTVRCCHPDTGEFINIGLIAWCGTEVRVRFVTNWSRARAFLPGADLGPLQRLIERHVFTGEVLQDIAALVVSHGNLSASGVTCCQVSPAQAIADSKVLRAEDFLPEA